MLLTVLSLFAPHSESANRTLANSLPELSLPSLFTPENESSIELSFRGTFVPLMC